MDDVLFPEGLAVHLLVNCNHTPADEDAVDDGLRGYPCGDHCAKIL